MIILKFSKMKKSNKLEQRAFSFIKTLLYEENSFDMRAMAINIDTYLSFVDKYFSNGEKFEFAMLEKIASSDSKTKKNFMKLLSFFVRNKKFGKETKATLNFALFAKKLYDYTSFRYCLLDSYNKHYIVLNDSTFAFDSECEKLYESKKPIFENV